MKFLSKAILGFIVLIAGMSFSQVALSEGGLADYDGLTVIVASINTKNKTMKLGDQVFAYNSNTAFVNYKGEKVSASDIRTGDNVTIRLDIAQRYIKTPVLGLVQVHSGVID